MNISLGIVALAVAGITASVAFMTLLLTLRARNEALALRALSERQAAMADALKLDLYSVEREVRSVGSSSGQVLEEIEALLERVPSGAEGDWEKAPSLDTTLMLREISHSLNTPLAQIEVAVRRASGEIAVVGGNQDVARSLESAKRSVDLIRAVVTSYRELYAISDRAGQAWDVSDLSGTLQGLWKVLIEIRQHEEGEPPLLTSGTSVSPTRLTYSNYLICSILLPLMQNAVECAAVGGEVEVDVHTIGPTDEGLSLEVRNTIPTKAELQLDRMNSSESFSTKGHEHSGLGLSTARTLTARIGEGPSFSLEGDKLVARVLLGKGGGLGR